MGYNKSLFESQPVNENFQCPICQEVLQDPHTTNPCDHTFCLACIQQCYLNRNNNNQIVCPICCVSIQSSDLRPTMRAFRNILGRIRIRCKFEPCSEVVELQHFEQHLLECAKNPDNKPKPCLKRCGADIAEKDIAEHDCVFFLQKQIITLGNNNSKQEEEIKNLTNELEKLRQNVRETIVFIQEYISKKRE